MNDEINQLLEPEDMAGLAAYRQLKPVERAFVDAYLSDLQQNAVAAGQKVIEFLKGSTRDSRNKVAHWHAQQMMQKPLVRAAISERVAELTRAMEISAYNVLSEVANIGRSSLGHYMTIDAAGFPDFDLTKCTPEQLAAIQSVELEYDAYGNKKKFKIKLHDKLGALDKLMRYMGLFDAENKPNVVDMQPSAPAAKQITARVSTTQAADLYARTLRGGQ